MEGEAWQLGWGINVQRSPKELSKEEKELGICNFTLKNQLNTLVAETKPLQNNNYHLEAVSDG